jgi:hypothetical protein
MDRRAEQPTRAAAQEDREVREVAGCDEGIDDVEGGRVEPDDGESGSSHLDSDAR